MTDREKVLAKWPDAICSPALAGGKFGIFSEETERWLGGGETSNAAWADAARRLSP